MQWRGRVAGALGSFLVTMVASRTALSAEAKPLLAGLTPHEAARHMTVPDGFRVTLAAGEPMVHQPLAMAMDHRGRLWIAEAYTYPQRAPDEKGKDKIVILEDTDGDRVMDRRKEFAEGLNLVSGLELGFGGVWVGAAPYLLFIPDRDGNDVPDGPPQVVLDGFGYEDTHETLNAFNWGPDGWLYGCHGVFTHSRVGKPGTPDSDRTGMNAAVWRFHPVRHDFEVFAWGTSNPWGVDFNDHGHAFITACVIPHLWHVIQGAHYQRQAGEHFNSYVFDDIKTIANHHHYAGDIREHAWWGQEPVTPQSTLDAGGGHAHCGAMVYLGDNWPAEYRNQIFMSNIHGNRINQDRLARQGSGYVGHHGPDILIANDRWFRGINLRYGPDGTVWLIDWYDRNACHRTSPEIWDRTNGRIYNVAYGTPESVAVNMSDLSDQQLVQLQLHPNDWYVRMARRLLFERSVAGQLDRSTVHQELRRILLSHPDATRVLRALWALHVTEGLSDQDLLDLSDHPEESVRGWAIQLTWEDRAASAAFVRRMIQLAEADPSPLVRLHLASAMQRMPLADRWPLAEQLLAHEEDANDHNLPLMYWYGIEPLVPADPQRAMRLIGDARIPTVARFIFRRAAAEDHSLEVAVQALADEPNGSVQRWMLEEILAAFENRAGIQRPRSWGRAYERLSASGQEDARQLADRVAVLLGDQRVFPRLRQLMTDRGAAIERRREALQTLVRGQDGDATGLIRQLLADPPLRADALRALAAFDDPETPAAVVQVYGNLSSDEKRDAVSTLIVRPTYARALIAAIEKGTIPASDVHAYHVRQLLGFRDQTLIDEVRRVWGRVRESSADKKAEIERYKQLITDASMATANPSRGRRIFDKTCATCHRLFGEGTPDVAPDITGSNRQNLDYILENIVDPNAVVGKEYRMTVLTLADGRVLSGLVQRETDSAITMRTLNETVVIAKSDIEQRQPSEASLMPEGQLEPMSADDVRDLVVYLASPTQVVAAGPDAPIDPVTGRVPEALEGEELKVRHVSQGNVRPQEMAGFRASRWSGATQLWWTGAAPGARLELALPVAESGDYDLELVLTRAVDYGVVRLWLDDQPLSEAVDLYHAPQVVSTGVFVFPARQLTVGQHRLDVEMVDANPQAVKAYMFGLDYLRLVPAPTAGGH